MGRGLASIFVVSPRNGHFFYVHFDVEMKGDLYITEAGARTFYRGLSTQVSPDLYAVASQQENDQPKPAKGHSWERGAQPLPPPGR